MFKIRFCSRLISGIYLIMLCIQLLSGCSGKVLNEDENQLMIRDTYIEVLQNNTELLYQGENIVLNEYLKNCGSNDYYFTVLDMDGDGIPEIVLKMILGSDMLVLHYDDKVVYGYSFESHKLRALDKEGMFIYDLKFFDADGKYNSTSSRRSKLHFSEGICEREETAYSVVLDNSSDYFQYYINGKEVSNDVYMSFVSEQNGKENVEWHMFAEKLALDEITNEIIANEFTVIWDNMS